MGDELRDLSPDDPRRGLRATDASDRVLVARRRQPLSPKARHIQAQLDQQWRRLMEGERSWSEIALDRFVSAVGAPRLRILGALLAGGLGAAGLWAIRQPPAGDGLGSQGGRSARALATAIEAEHQRNTVAGIVSWVLIAFSVYLAMPLLVWSMGTLLRVLGRAWRRGGPQFVNSQRDLRGWVSRNWNGEGAEAAPSSNGSADNRPDRE